MIFKLEDVRVNIVPVGLIFPTKNKTLRVAFWAISDRFGGLDLLLYLPVLFGLDHCHLVYINKLTSHKRNTRVCKRNKSKNP